MQEQNGDPSAGEDVATQVDAERLVHVDLIANTVRWPAIFMAMVVGVTMGVTIGVIIGLGGTNAAWIVMVITLPAFFLTMFLIRKRVERQVERIVEQRRTASLSAVVSTVFKGRRKAGTLGLPRVMRLAQALAANNRFGPALRLCSTKNATPLKPFEIVFEAQSLDQTGETFRHLEATGGEPSDDSTTAPVDVAGDDTTWLKIRRNVSLRGGWIIAGILLFVVLLNTFFSYVEGRIRPSLLLWIAFFLMTLFGATGATRSRKQWFAVPGGLIVRKAGFRDRRWKVHLLEPANSVLVVFQAGRRQWIACAATEDFFDRVVMTEREADFLLRAWLSPLSPPPVEKLTDLQ